MLENENLNDEPLKLRDIKDKPLAFLVEVGFFARIQIGGEPGQEVAGELLDHLEDEDATEIVAQAIKAIQGSQEIEQLVFQLAGVGASHKSEYPHTKIYITPCIGLSEPQEIK